MVLFPEYKSGYKFSARTSRTDQLQEIDPRDGRAKTWRTNTKQETEQCSLFSVIIAQNLDRSSSLVLSPGGGGAMTLHDNGYLLVPAARIFKELPCFGVKFSNINPSSESGFLEGIFGGGGQNLLLICKFLLLC